MEYIQYWSKGYVDYVQFLQLKAWPSSLKKEKNALSKEIIWMVKVEMHRRTSVFRRQMSAKGVSTRKRTFTFIADMQFQALKGNHGKN